MIPSPYAASFAAVLALAVASPLAAETVSEYEAKQRERARQAELDSGVYRPVRVSAPTQLDTTIVRAPPAETDYEREQRLEREAAATKRQNERLEADWRAQKAATDAYFKARQNEGVLNFEPSEATRQRRAKEWAAYEAQREMDRAASALRARRILAVAAPGSPEAAEVIKGLKLESEDGSWPAIAVRGWLLVQGVHTALNPTVGRDTLKRAIDHSALIALVPYAQCLERGLGGPADPLEARLWFRSAIACGAPGWPIAMRALALMDEEGRGAKADLVEAVRWYRMAASGGDAWSQLRLAQMQRDGLGMPADAKAARAAFMKLVDSPDPDVATGALVAIKGLP